MKGFTLLELIITISILAILSITGVSSYRSYTKNVEVTSTVQSIVTHLRQAQAKAMANDSGYKWGVMFVNNPTEDHYTIYSTLGVFGGAVDTETFYLPKNVSFSSPANNQSTDVLFTRISGTTTATSVTLFSENITKTISITSAGIVNQQ